MHGEDIQGFECHRVIAAEHILITEQIGEVGGERMAYAFVFDLGD